MINNNFSHIHLKLIFKQTLYCFITFIRYLQLCLEKRILIILNIIYYYFINITECYE